MKTKQITAILLCFVLGLSFMLVGCNGKPIQKIERPEKLVKVDYPEYQGYKFEPAATISTFRFFGPQVKFQKGENMSNNIWYRAYEKYLGLKIKNLIEVTDSTAFDTRVTAALATNKLPDLIPVYTTLFFRIADAGKFYDLSGIYEKYADKDVKVSFEERGGGLAYKTCYFDNKLHALSIPPEPSTDFLWIREDWLQKYNLAWPKNINETINVMKTFAENNASGSNQGTMAMPLDKNLGGLNGFANAFGAYRGIWIDDGTGKLVRGETLPVWKTVLQQMSDLRAAGYIDTEFIYKGSNEITNEYAQERFGVAFAGTSAPDGSINNSVEANPKAVWKHDVTLDVNGEPAKAQFETRIGGFTGMNKDSPYPESIILIANIWSDLIHGKGQEFQQYHDFVGKDGNRYDSFFYPILGGLGSIPFYNQVSQELVSKALETGDKSELNGEQLGYLDRMMPWHTDKEPKGWRMYAIFGPGGSMVTQKKILENQWFMPNKGWGPETETWVDKGPELSSKNTEYFSRIIMGDYGGVENGFAEWMNYWNTNGGTEVTNEINEWWKSEGKKGFKDFTYSK